MNLNHYLKHHRRYEIAFLVLLCILVVVINATTVILDNIRDGLPGDFLTSWVLESTGVCTAFLLLPLLYEINKKIDLQWSNFQQRWYWHIPGFILYSLLHIAIFISLRKMLWASWGDSYILKSVGFSLIYEMRKDFLVYCGIILSINSYSFILSRLQGEAKFLSSNLSKSSLSPSNHQVDDYKTQFLVKMLDKEFLVRVNEINWINSASNYVLLNCENKSYPMRQTLTKLSGQLDPQQFMRVHRTAIINLKSVASLKERGEIQLELVSGDVIPVSKTYLTGLKKALTKNTGYSNNVI